MTASNSDILLGSLTDLSDSIRQKRVSPVEVTQQALDRIEQTNPKLNAFITVLQEKAIENARTAEREIVEGNWRGPLHGVPIGLKDLVFTEGVRTTMGARIFKDYIPDYSATVVNKLEEAGAVLLGKLNTHEFAYGPTGDRSFFGPVKNPYDLEKITGGSSSGSGAAVAAGMVFAALGTDTGGSIRIPAAHCGIVGMKPTFGRVSKYGVYPLAWTLDHIGPMTRTVRDNAILLNVLAGYDPKDPYTVQLETEDFTRLLEQGVKNSVIGVPSNFYFDYLDPEVEREVRQAIELFRRLGADIREIEIPQLPDTLLAQQITIKSEAYAIHRQLLEERGTEYDEEVKERLLTGIDTKAYEYVDAQELRQAGRRAYLETLQKVDLLLAPATPILPTPIGQRDILFGGKTDNVRAVITRLTGPTNVTGLPSLVVPCGFSQSGLPIGLQLIGKPYEEANLYRFGYAFEQEIGLPKGKRV
ncbi:amidase [Effusibacillus dendaii]|uniref:Amidase n=1 Tax=Effusibacillus dendaii TaxID=2743772 RepID=A0A7I8DBS4_9BACL|nr:amidase [Effusibacillus dendaii]BCJ87608.1 amidase [Effusibacillus dendaii]